MKVEVNALVEYNVIEQCQDVIQNFNRSEKLGDRSGQKFTVGLMAK